VLDFSVKRKMLVNESAIGDSYRHRQQQQQVNVCVEVAEGKVHLECTAEDSKQAARDCIWTLNTGKIMLLKK